MLRHRLTDEQWNRIADLFTLPAKTGRPPRDRRQIVDAILWILRTGAPWRDLPEEFGPWGTAWDLFDKWNADGTLDRILSRLQVERIDAGKFDDQLWCIDGTVVRERAMCRRRRKKGDPQEPADHALGRSRGGFSTKIHILCDGDGHPLHFHLTAGQDHETTALIPLMEGADERLIDGEGKPIPWPGRPSAETKDMAPMDRQVSPGVGNLTGNSIEGERGSSRPGWWSSIQKRVQDGATSSSASSAG